eukprot:4786401-Prymnesium_polylepis.1
MFGLGCAYLPGGGRRGARGRGVHGWARGAQAVQQEADNLGRHGDREGLALATPQQGRCPRQ